MRQHMIASDLADHQVHLPFNDAAGPVAVLGSGGCGTFRLPGSWE